MNKKIYTLCLLALTGSGAFAQNRIATPTNQHLNLNTPFFSHSNIVATPTDTLWGNLANWTGAVCGRTDMGGYVMGNNGYLDKQKVMAFSTQGPTIIIGSIYWFGAKEITNGGPSSVVKMRIYKMDGTNGTTSTGTGSICPNTVSVSDDVNITLIDTSSSLANAFIHTFSTPYYTTQDFGVGFDVTGLLPGDTVGGVYSADGSAGLQDMSWDMFSNGTWHTWLETPANWGLNSDLAVFPIVSMNTGIEETFINGVHLSTYPNPTVDNATISYGLQKDASNAEIKILDATGKVVAVLPQGKQTAGTHTLDLDARSYTAGTYFVLLSAGGGHVATKLVIQ